ncbi:hypothetical protein CLF_111973 [Clonorchis sinensis]|uniref:Uncharacterized protein n=1 Tax=Clonorchis sinensis TaxID=79923 RepID=G7YM64_CLOSI|nr:hypothetical protein CLF_111973 [Clonorchis sinensis]
MHEFVSVNEHGRRVASNVNLSRNQVSGNWAENAHSRDQIQLHNANKINFSGPEYVVSLINSEMTSVLMNLEFRNGYMDWNRKQVVYHSTNPKDRKRFMVVRGDSEIRIDWVCILIRRCEIFEHHSGFVTEKHPSNEVFVRRSLAPQSPRQFQVVRLLSTTHDSGKKLVDSTVDCMFKKMASNINIWSNLPKLLRKPPCSLSAMSPRLVNNLRSMKNTIVSDTTEIRMMSWCNRGYYWCGTRVACGFLVTPPCMEGDPMNFVTEPVELRCSVRLKFRDGH